MSDNPYQSPLCYGPRRKWLTKERAVWLMVKVYAATGVVAGCGILIMAGTRTADIFAMSVSLIGTIGLFGGWTLWCDADVFLEPKDSP